jgi:hypothetical protein
MWVSRSGPKCIESIYPRRDETLADRPVPVAAFCGRQRGSLYLSFVAPKSY